MTTTIGFAMALVRDELERAIDRYPPFNGPHEGYAVILEEMDELWAEVKANNPARQTAEVIQVAAMAIRFLMDQHPKPDQAANCGFTEQAATHRHH